MKSPLQFIGWLPASALKPQSAVALILTVCVIACPSIIADSSRSFVDEYRLFRQREPNRPTPARTQAIEHAWTLFEYVPDAFPGVRRNRRTAGLFDEAYFRRAMSGFEEARRTAQEMRKRLGLNKQLREQIRAGVWWRRIDAHARFDRKRSRIHNSYRRQLTYRYHFVIRTLEQIRSQAMKRERRVRILRKVAMRFYAVHQIKLGEFIRALPVLQEYERLYPSAAGEWPLHYYLSACYAAAFRQARRDTGQPEYRLRQLRRKMNLHLLRAVELKYGLKSYEYEMTWRRVRLDELGGVRSR